jgi:predicted Fe-Mo cluster-binding NifX family protein
MSVKIALAVDSSGERLEHFGKTEEFVVYEIGDAEPVQQEVRRADAFCRDLDKQPRLESVVDLLADCQAVVCAAIGPCARQELAGVEIAAYEFNGTVTNAIQAIARRRAVFQRPRKDKS